MFTVGTGVGGGLVLGGRLYRGVTGAAAEVGTRSSAWTSTRARRRAARFPQPGSLEALASGRALDQLAEEAARAEPDSALGRRLAAAAAVTGIDAVDGSPARATRRRPLLRILGERLGIGIANAINLFDPREVVIGGGVSGPATC